MHNYTFLLNQFEFVFLFFHKYNYFQKVFLNQDLILVIFLLFYTNILYLIKLGILQYRFLVYLTYLHIVLELGILGFDLLNYYLVVFNFPNYLNKSLFVFLVL